MPEFLALKHESRILGHSSNPVCGFGSAKPVLHGTNSTEPNLFHHGETTFRVGWLILICYSHTLERRCLRTADVATAAAMREWNYFLRPGADAVNAAEGFDIDTPHGYTTWENSNFEQHQNSFWANKTNDPFGMGCDNIPISRRIFINAKPRKYGVSSPLSSRRPLIPSYSDVFGSR